MKFISLTVAAFLLGLVAGETHDHDHNITRVGCPTDDSIRQECYDAVTPPLPICLGSTAAEWVAKAIDSSTRCCGDDLTECKCPVKEGVMFKEKIGPFCDAVQNYCMPEGSPNLRGGMMK
mmetsp:Transcript_9993/g.15107  ORF Transcript_9993/g.15107 Transcript_9993/m.15107 type:complete len:120 (-) Transcript_9993:314-673(-)